MNNNMEGKLYKTNNNTYILVDPTKGTYDDGYTLGTSRESQYNKLSIKNCESIEHGYDLDELASDIDYEKVRWSTEESLEHFGYMIGIKDGFQKALEILGDKKFSEEDVISMIEKSRETGLTAEYLILAKQQTEWDVEVEMEKVKDETKIIGSVKGVKGSGNKITTYKSVPKLDTDGCLILKRI